MQRVSLQAFVDEMDMPGDEMTAYINKKTGELITIDEEMAGIIERGDEDDEFIPDWLKEILPRALSIASKTPFIAGAFRKTGTVSAMRP